MPHPTEPLTSLWSATTKPSTYPALTSDRRVDVAIIGGGIMGITAAHLLKQAGRTVAVVERDRCGQGETGRSAAHLTTVADLSPSRIVAEFGSTAAKTVWDAGAAAMARIRANVRDERINCQFAWVPGWLHATAGRDAERARAEMRREADAAASLGIDATYLDTVRGMDQPGVRFENQARLNPAAYLDVLTSRVAGDGSYVFEQSEVEAVEDRPLAVCVGHHRVRADYLIVATHVPLTAAVGGVPGTLLRVHLRPTVTYAVSGVAPRGDMSEGLYWEHVSGPYEYLRVDRSGDQDIVVIGGQDHKVGQGANPDVAFSCLEERLSTRVPGVRVTHRWSGQVVESKDGLPYIGEPEPGRFMATAFGGNGLTFGTLAGMMAADAALGRGNPWKTLFDVNRTRPTARNYFKANNDYVYDLIRDGYAAVG